MESILGDVVSLTRDALGAGLLDLGTDGRPIETRFVDGVDGGSDPKMAAEVMTADDIAARVGWRLCIGTVWILNSDLHDGWFGCSTSTSGSGLVGGGFPTATPPSQGRWCEEARQLVREDVLDAWAVPYREVIAEQLVIP